MFYNKGLYKIYYGLGLQISGQTFPQEPAEESCKFIQTYIYILVRSRQHSYSSNYLALDFIDF